MDTPSIETATKVWRWNNSGLGYSESGYPGPYTTAWTIDGAFNADFITAGSISANLIKSGLLQSLNGTTTMDLDSGEITINQNDGGKIKLTKYGIIFGEGPGNNQGQLYYSGEQSNAVLDFGEFNKEIRAPIYSYTFEKNGQSAMYQFFSGNRLSLYNKDTSSVIAELKNKTGAGGQLELRNESGKATFSFSNRSGGGAECWIGEGNGAYKIFDYLNSKIRVFAHQLTLYGKANIISGGGLSNSECSAYIVYGRPTSGGHVSSIVIPADIATNYDWQLADETNYIKFRMDSNGGATKVKGSSNSGGIIGVYSIR